MSDANVLLALKKEGRNGSLDNIVVFGRVRCAIEKPYVVGNNLEFAPGFFAIIDVYALKCQGTDYFSEGGTWDLNKTYFTRGNMIIYLDNKEWIGKDVKVYGASTRYGVKIKRQYSAKSETDGVCAFVFKRVNNKFIVVPNKVVALCEKDPDAKGTNLEDYIVNIVTSKSVKYAETTQAILPFNGVENYTELPLNRVQNAFEYVESDEMVDVTKIDLHLTYHLSTAPKSVFCDSFDEEIEEKSKLRKNYAKHLTNLILDSYTNEMRYDFNPEESGYSCTEDTFLSISEIYTTIRKKFISEIASRYTQPIGESGVRGREFVDELISVMSNPSWSEHSDDLSGEELLKAINYLESIVAASPDALYGHSGEICDGIPMLDPLKFAIAVVGVTTGISVESLLACKRYCERSYTMSAEMWFYSLIRAPYLLCMLGTNLSIVDADILYLSYYKAYAQKALYDENISLRGDILFLENLRESDDKDSMVQEYRLKTKESYYPGRASSLLKRNYFPATVKYIDALVWMCGSVLLSEKGVQNFLSFSWYSPERLEDLENKGIVNRINEYSILESDLEKEYFIYTTLWEKGNALTGISEDTINSVIQSFQESRGFELNELQVAGCKLTMYKAAVLSGCAGSGKTTTSDCMSEILRTLGDDYSLVYCTPTGKACRRLAEVVHTTVRTLHSQFSIGLTGESYINTNVGKRYSNQDEKEKKIFILDEMGMASMPLLYEVVRNLNDGDLVYFLGDIKQLPAIGKGCPFAILMKLLPCIELGVSKRAAEGSLVNYNTTLINNMSDGIVRALKYDDSTFIKIDCPDASLPMTVRNTWKSFMDGKIGNTSWSEDDIQVITGYQKQDIIFSTPNLNPVIQEMLRSKDKLLFRHVSRPFYNNDRVIHTTVNNYDMQRYIETEPNTFEAVPTFGVVNGETGKLVGVVRSDMCHINDVPDFDYNLKDFSKEEAKELRDKYLERLDSLRKDLTYVSNKTYFVKIKVWDVDLQKDVILLYRARGHVQDGELILEGIDLSHLDLAYALSTHKMQGSQSPVVIIPLGKRCNPNFINRNMINTMITRSQGVVALLGNISGSDSALTQGRQKVSNFNCKDSLSILVNNEMF